MVNTLVSRITSLKFNRCGVYVFSWAVLFCLNSQAFVNAQEIDWQVLNLTPQQQNHMHDLEKHWQQIHQSIMGQIERDSAELRTILPTGDSARIRQLQNQIMDNKTYLMRESMDTFLRKREMLSPDQRNLLQKMLPCYRSAKQEKPATQPAVTDETIAPAAATPQ